MMTKNDEDDLYHVWYYHARNPSVLPYPARMFIYHRPIVQPVSEKCEKVQNNGLTCLVNRIEVDRYHITTILAVFLSILKTGKDK